MKSTKYISGGNFLCFIAESLKATDGNRESKAKETKEININQSSADKVQSVGRQRRVVGNAVVVTMPSSMASPRNSNR